MTDKMREEFEVSFVAEQVRLFGEGFRSSALYMIEQDTINVRSAWWAWQASREALVVDLSDLSNCFSPDGCGDWAMWLSDVNRLIEAAGVKVKP